VTGNESHAPHVSRHLEQLLRLRGSEKVQALLKRCGFQFEQGRATRLSGAELDAQDCGRYLAAVKEVLGDSAYSFTKANFTLAQCSSVGSAP
jgi:hypothetical protein